MLFFLFSQFHPFSLCSSTTIFYLFFSVSFFFSFFCLPFLSSFLSSSFSFLPSFIPSFFNLTLSLYLILPSFLSLIEPIKCIFCLNVILKQLKTKTRDFSFISKCHIFFVSNSFHNYLKKKNLNESFSLKIKVFIIINFEILSQIFVLPFKFFKNLVFIRTSNCKCQKKKFGIISTNPLVIKNPFHEAAMFLKVYIAFYYLYY